MREAVLSDAEAICGIYNHYVRHSTITFEEAPVSSDEMGARIQDVKSAALPWIVEEVDGAIVGYGYASKWKARAAYRYSVETSIYLPPKICGAGVGTRLYGSLLGQLKERDFHLAIGGIALPNDASIRLHEKFGFRKVAEFTEVGFKFNRWIDVGYWQLSL